MEESRRLIAEALMEFHPTLGEKAHEIFEAGFESAATQNSIEEIHEPISLDRSRWRIREVPPGQAAIMRCVPALSEGSELNPVNPHNHAVIQYEFDGTIGGAVYLAHELGHAIADDYQREAGNIYRDNPEHQVETQAYLVQNIFYDYLKRHENPEIRMAALTHFQQTMNDNLRDLPNPDRTHERPLGILTAASLVREIRDQPENARRQISEMLLGRYGHKTLSEIFETAGVQTQAEMDALAKATVAAIMDQGSKFSDFQKT